MRTIHAAVLLLLLGAMLTTFPTGGEGSVGPPPMTRGSAGMNYTSMGGTELAEDFASARLIGEEFARTGGATGSYTWTGDMNGDGIDDLAVAAPQAPTSGGLLDGGIVYVYYGDDTPIKGTFDMEEVEPDIRIVSSQGLALTSQMVTGDFNGDGRTDLAMCLPSVDMHTYGTILFSPEGGWPSTITIGIGSTDAALRPIYFRDCGPTPTSLDSQMSFFMHSGDWDRDGFDDLAYGGFRNNDPAEQTWYFTMAWGGNRTYNEDPTYPDISFTRFEDMEPISTFGSAVGVGDFDGDGWADAAVAAPQQIRSDIGLYKCGEVYLYFNISQYRGNDTLPYADHYDKRITGSADYDRFGVGILVDDVNRDGIDDMLISAPYSDGEGIDEIDCGMISVFHGGPRASFPFQMDARSDADMVILGPKGTINRQGDGFQLGQMFRLGDLTGEGDPDLVTTVKGMDLPSISSDLRLKAGVLMVYEYPSVFGQQTPLVRLGYPSKVLTLEGTDLEDSFGFHLSLGDIDDNGLDDIVVGAPGGDGIDNERPRAGEVFVLYTADIRLRELTLGGPGHDGGDVFASGGMVRFDVPVTRHGEARAIEEVEFSFSMDGPPIVLTADIGGQVTVEDPYGCIDASKIAFSMPGIGATTALSMAAWVDWDYPWRTGTDVRVTVRDAGGSNITRLFRDAFTVRKDLSFGEGSLIEVNGSPLPAMGVWTKVGDTLTLGGIPVVYRGRADREVLDGMVELTISRDDHENVVPYGNGWYMTDIVSSPPVQRYTITARPFPVSEDGDRMGSTAEKVIEINVDATPPVPGEISLQQPGSEASGLGKAGEWTISVGTGLGAIFDNDGSGVREYLVGNSASDMSPMKGQGGLLATYYLDTEMMDEGLDIVEDGVDHEWGVWGPYPEKRALPPSSFSTRWHGWIDVEVEGSYRFQISGRGEGSLMFDGEPLIWRDDLEFSPRTDYIDLSPGDPKEIILHYFHTNASEPSSFHFWWFNEEGRLVPVPYSVMRYPTNVTVLNIDGPERTSLIVRSVDWAGISSDPVLADARVDWLGPSIDMGLVLPWTNLTEPELVVHVTEPEIGYFSGVDLASASYRVLSEGESFGTWVKEGIRFGEEVETGGVLTSTAVFFDPQLWSGFKGTIEFEIADLAGNVVRSAPISIGVDRSRPSVTLLHPDHRLVQDNGSFDAVVRVEDFRGSGADLSTMMYRVDTGSGWGEWTSPGLEGIVTDEAAEHPLELPEGRISLEYRIMDLAGNHGGSPVYDIRIERPPVDMPPVPVIASPRNGTVFIDGTPIELSAKGTRDDGLGLYDPVVMTWTSNVSGHLGSGLLLPVYLPVGEHTITLFADDGTPGHNVSVSVRLRVVPAQGPGPEPGSIEPENDMLGAAIVVLIVVLVLVFGIGFLVMRSYGRAGTEETRLDMDGRSME